MMVDLIIDRTQADVLEKTEKGFYGKNDLVRVTTAMRKLAVVCAENGYPVSLMSKMNWVREDIPSIAQMDDYIGDLTRLRQIIGAVDEIACVSIVGESVVDMGGVAGNGGIPAAPARMDLTWPTANTIERILYLLNQALDNLQKSVVPCGTASSGDDYL